MLALLALHACDAPTADPPVAGGEPAAPAWSAADVGAEVEAALTLGLPEPWSLNRHYLEQIGHGDELCPGPDSQMQMPDDVCEINGYSYFGVATWWDTSTEDLAGFYMFTASFVITPPEGAPYRAGGSYQYAEAEDGTWSAFVEGVFVDEDEPAWLAEEVSAALTLEGSMTDDLLVLEGGVTVGERVVWFDHLVTGSACGGLVSGAIRARAPDGAWYDLDFGDACSDCGSVSLDGEALGEACVDLSAAFDGVRAARASP